MIRFSCPTCQKVLKVANEGAGCKINCPKCGQRLQIPNPVKPAARNQTVLGEPLADSIVSSALPAPAWLDEVWAAEEKRKRPSTPCAGTVTVFCPDCNARLLVDAVRASGEAECLQCGRRFAVGADVSDTLESPWPLQQPSVDVAPIGHPALPRIHGTTAKLWWRPISPSLLILALLVFPLPWIEVSCSGGGMRGKVLASQSGFQSIYGGISKGVPIPPGKEGELDARRKRDQAQGTLEFWDCFAPLMLVYAPLLAMAAFFGFLLRPSRLRAALIVGLTGLVLICLLLHVEIGFPLERELYKSMGQDLVFFEVHYTAWFWIGLFSIIATLLASALERFAITNWRRSRNSFLTD